MVWSKKVVPITGHNEPKTMKSYAQKNTYMLSELHKFPFPRMVESIYCYISSETKIQNPSTQADNILGTIYNPSWFWLSVSNPSIWRPVNNKNEWLE